MIQGYTVARFILFGFVAVGINCIGAVVGALLYGQVGQWIGWNAFGIFATLVLAVLFARGKFLKNVIPGD